MTSIFTEDFTSIADWNVAKNVVADGGKLKLATGKSVGYAIRRQGLDTGRITSLSAPVTANPGTEGTITVLFSRDRRHYTIADEVSGTYTVSSFHDTDGTCDFIDEGAIDYSKRTACIMVLLQTQSHPHITSIDPTESDGDDTSTLVTVLGDDFRLGARVMFGGIDSPHVEYVNENKVKAITPDSLPHEEAVNVELVNPDGGSAFLGSAFTQHGDVVPPPSDYFPAAIVMGGMHGVSGDAEFSHIAVGEADSWHETLLGLGMSTNAIWGFDYSNAADLYVFAVGGLGLYSAPSTGTDKVPSTSLTLRQSGLFYDVAFSPVNNHFLAVGAGGASYSANGISWTSLGPSWIADYTWFKAVWTNGLTLLGDCWLLMSIEGRIAKYVVGNGNIELLTDIPNVNLYSAIYAENIALAVVGGINTVTNDGTVLTSTDGSTWVAQTLPDLPGPPTYVFGLGYRPDIHRVIAIGPGIYAGSEGSYWTKRDNPVGMVGPFYSVVWTGNLLYAPANQAGASIWSMNGLYWFYDDGTYWNRPLYEDSNFLVFCAKSGQTVPTLPPSVPGAPTVTQSIAHFDLDPTDYNCAQISWSPTPGAATYQVKRSTVSGGPYTLQETTDAINSSDTHVQPLTTYYYVIAAVNSAGTSIDGPEGSFTSNSLPFHA